ncbi:hypothetical protein U0070_009030, partial [Myodes glareolus]
RFIATKVIADAISKKWKDCVVHISDRNDKKDFLLIKCQKELAEFIRFAISLKKIISAKILSSSPQAKT